MASRAKRTDPDLWEQVKAEITQSEKGGRPGQWSARKAQMAVQVYKARGGGYAGEKRDDNALRQWTDEDWGTKSGKRSRDGGERYLPKSARQDLSDEDYRRTTDKKRADTAKGRQFSRQPEDVAERTARHRHTGPTSGANAGKGGEAGEPTKRALYTEAKRRDIPGRSTMDKAALMEALR